jgi:ribose 5-phosphate isomerase
MTVQTRCVIQQNNMNVGIGSGSTVVYVVERLIQRVKLEKLSKIKLDICVSDMIAKFCLLVTIR